MQPNSRQVVLLAVSGLVIAIGILVYAYLFFISGTVQDTAGANQDSTAVTEEVLVLDVDESDDSSWQQPFIEQVTDYETVSEPISPDPTVSESPSSMVMESPVEEREPMSTPDLTPEPAPSITVPDSVVPQTPPQATSLPQLETAGATDCGEVEVGTSLFAILDFIGTAESNPPIVCLGEQVGSGCDTAYFSTTDGARIYVAEPPNAACGIGIAAGEDVVLLCDLETLVNEPTETSAGWQAIERDFRAEPGLMMSQLIQANYMDFMNGTIDTATCVEYALE